MGCVVLVLVLAMVSGLFAVLSAFLAGSGSVLLGLVIVGFLALGFGVVGLVLVGSLARWVRRRRRRG
jgi:hypothetical protein